LAPLLQDPNIERRQFAISEFALEMMYLDRDWKLMLNRESEPYRLFDIEKDPHEMEDLIGRKEFEVLIAELKSKLLDRRKQTEKVRA
jgi:arylsulfatase A-like enzyme